jgi:hypothetical protein
MSAIISEAEASKPQQQQKKMQECFKCKAAGFPNQLIGFQKVGEDVVTGKNIWKLINENGVEHKHKYLQSGEESSQQQQQQQQQQVYHNGYYIKTNNNNSNNNSSRPIFRRRRVVDIATVADVEDARKMLAQGWDFQTSYPATISNIPHYVLVRRE